MTADEFANSMNDLEACIASESKRIQRAALTGVIGEYKNRIFIDGEATDGSLISSKVKAKKLTGAYSKGHARERRTARPGRGTRQIQKVDLFLQGNLFAKLLVGDSGDDVVLGFTNTRQREIADSHEEYRRQKIFALNTEEIEIVTESGVAEANAILEECLNR